MIPMSSHYLRSWGHLPGGDAKKVGPPGASQIYHLPAGHVPWQIDLVGEKIGAWGLDG